MRPFANPGYDTPLQGPDMGRPILGASKSRFVFLYVLVDSLIAGVRKTQEDTLKVFIWSTNSACKTNKEMGK